MSFTYAPALESIADIDLRERYGLFIGGAWVAPSDGTYLACENPATELPLALVARASPADVERAVRAARRGYDKYWRKLKAPERAKYLFRIARAVDERARAIAVRESLSSGMPIRFARNRVCATASAHAFYAAGWADKLAWAVRGHERAHAVGVVGAMVPGYAAFSATLAFVAPALACGNTVVLVPDALAPLGAFSLAQICADVDLPPGVFNVITGDATVGASLVDHPDVDLLARAGTIAEGAALRRSVAGRRTRVHLTLDGVSTIVVYDDAPLDAAIENIVAAMSLGGSRANFAGVRILAAESIAAEILDRVKVRLVTLRHGDPLDKNTDVGALPSRAHRDALVGLAAAASAEGATILGAPWSAPERGYWHPASLVIDLPASFDASPLDRPGLATFGTFRTPSEALERANAAYGALAASVWTSSGSLGLYTAQRLEAGAVWCNTFDRVDASSPFGGTGEAGFGRSGGLAGLRAFLEM